MVRIDHYFSGIDKHLKNGQVNDWTEELDEAARQNDLAAVKAAVQKSVQNCVDCHANHRNQ